MSSVNRDNKQPSPIDVDSIAEEFLDLWQENIRLWAEERDLFTLQNFMETVKQHMETPTKESADG